MSLLDNTYSAGKVVTITIPNVPQELWRDFQDQALRQNTNVGSFIVSLMAGALDKGEASGGTPG